MHVAIVGSRQFKNKQQVFDLVNSFPQKTVVVSGGCAGPDTWAEIAAKKRRLKTVVFLPHYPPYGSPRYEFTKAFYARNQLIAESCDALYAFVANDRKGGTEHTIGCAMRLGKLVVIHYEQSNTDKQKWADAIGVDVGSIFWNDL